MKAQHRNAPFVFLLGVDLAVAIVVGDHLAAPGEADERAVVAPRIFLVLLSVGTARELIRRGIFHAGHAPPAAKFDVIAAGEAELAGDLLLVEPPRHVDVHAPRRRPRCAAGSFPAPECGR